MPTYETLQTKNPEYDDAYWAKVRTLYEGAKSMRDVLAKPGPLRESLLFRRLGEEDDVYDDRCKQACYSPHMTQLIDYILSVLFSDPVEMTAGGQGEDRKPGSVDKFYDEFFKNTSRPGAKPISLNELLRGLAKNALLYRRTWLLVDFPKAPVNEAGEPIRPGNRVEEEALGLDRAYCVPIDPDDVFDWEVDDAGQLVFALVHNKTQARESATATRDRIVETFTEYTRTGWTRYTWEYSEKKPPSAKSQPTLTESGSHTFGRVPLIPIEVPEGLWAGGKMESLAIEIFNARSGLSWSRNRSLFQMIVAKLSQPDPTNPVSEDPDRGLNQVVGPGRVITLAEKDSYEYVGPEASPFKEAREDIRDLVEDLHRVLHQLAQSASQGASKQKQSGQSKQMDASAGAIVSKELGRVFRDVATTILAYVSAGRKEEKDWEAKGLSEFDDVTLDNFVNEAAVLETVPIPSPTFQTLYKFDLAERILPGLTDEQKDQIYEELEAAHTAEAMIDDAKNEALLEDPLQRGSGDDAGEKPPKASEAGEKDDAKKDDAKKGEKPAPKPPVPPKKAGKPTGKKPAKSPRQPKVVK